MKRSFNSTGRRKIPLDMLNIRLKQSSDGRKSFTADLSKLLSLGIDPTAEVIVEPYVGTSMMRFRFGTAAAIVPPADCNLDELDEGKLPLFRIKVVGKAHNSGCLIALADRVQPADEHPGADGRQFLLPLKEYDLGEAIWQLTELNGDERPSLVINSRIPDLYSRITTDPILQGAIFAVVVRDIMREVLFGSLDEETEWVTEWREFSESLLGEELPSSPPADSEDEITGKIVDAFLKQMQFATAANPHDPAMEPGYD